MKKLLACLGALACAVGVSACSSDAGAPIPVAQAAARTGTFSSGYSTLGVVQPQVQVDVVPTYAGHVLKTYKQVGDKVTAGDTLLQIDTKSITNQIKAAKAGLAQANAGMTSANTNVTQASTGVSKANAALAAAKAALATTTNGTNAATLAQYQAAVSNATIANDSAQQGLQLAQAAFDALQQDPTAAPADVFAAQSALIQAKAAAQSAQVALSTAKKNLSTFQNVTSKQAVAAAKANVDAAKAGVTSAHVGVASAQAGVDASQAAVNTSQTSIDNLRSQRDDYTVTSPITGIVLSKTAIAGGTIGAVPAYQVGNIDKVLITTAVPKSELDKLALGGQAEVFFPDGTSVLTQVSALSATPNAANLYMVQMLVDNAAGALRPGMDANVVFVDQQFESLIVPIGAVVTSGQDAYVFVNDNGRAHKVAVSVTAKNAIEAAIKVTTGSLADGASVITTNAALLRDGDAITTGN